MTFTNREVWFALFTASMGAGQYDMVQLMAKYLAVCKELAITPLSFPEIRRAIDEYDTFAQAMTMAVAKHAVGTIRPTAQGAEEG